MNIQRLTFTQAAFLFVLAMSLVGCGGGGGSSSTPTPNPSSTATTSSASSVASQANTSSSLSSLSSAPSSASSSLESSSSSSALIAGAVIVDKAPDVQVKVETAVLNSNVINADASLVKKLSNGVFIGEFNAPRSQVWAAGQIIMQDQQAYKVLAVLIDDDGSWLLQTKSAEISDVYKDLKFSVVAHGVGYDADGRALTTNIPALQQKFRLQKTYNEQSMFEKYPCLMPTATIELPPDFGGANTDSSDSEYGFYLTANCSVEEFASSFTLNEKLKSILNKITIAGKLGYTSRTKLYFDSTRGDNYIEQSATYGASELAIKFSDDAPITQEEKESLVNEDRRCKYSKGDIACEYALDFQSFQIPGTPIPVYVDTGMKFIITFSLTGSVTIKVFSIKTTKLSGYKNKILQSDQTKISDKAFEIGKPTLVGSLDFYGAVTGGAAIGYSIGTAKASLSYASLSIGPYLTISGTSDFSGAICAKGELGARAEIDISLFKTSFSDGYQILNLNSGYPIKTIGSQDCNSNEAIHIDYAIAGKKYYNYNNPESNDGLDVFDASYALIENTKAADGTKQIIIDLSETKGIDGNPLGIEVYSPITSKNIFSKVIKNADGTHKAIISTGDITYGDTLNFVIKAFDSTNRAKTEVTRNVDVRFEKYFSATPKVSDEIDKDGNPIWFVTHNLVGDISKITEDCISFASALDYCSIFSMFDPQYTWFLQRGNAEATKPKKLKFVTKAIEKNVKDYLHSFDIADEVTPKYSSITVSPNQVKVGDTLTLKITGLGLRGTLPLTMPNCSALVEVLSEGNIKNNNISTMERTFTCKATKAGENLFAEVPSALIMSNIFSVTATTGNSSSSSSSSSATSNTLIPEFVPIPGKTFSMSKYETTFAEYDAYVEATGAAKPADSGWGRGNRPVINVSWNDAVAYAAWLSTKTGKNYRLPTEEEWEFAARAGTTTDYPWGNEIGINNANCSGCGSQWDNKQTAPAGSFAANGFGLFDMHGNAYEWTSSCYITSCDYRVLRGGSWNSHLSFLSSAYRYRNLPTFRDNAFGFRLVQDTPITAATPEFVPIPGKSFSMSKYETTVAEYDAYAEETGVAKPDDAGWGRGSRPVINVSWNDAVAYAAWLSTKTGKNYRLPTEEEWEFAARAGTTTDYPWGNATGINNANCNGCGSQWDNKQTAPAGSFSANSFGLFDMHGNVNEWTSSCDLFGCLQRVYRGGSWNWPGSTLHSSYRNATGTGQSFLYSFIGFRLVQDISTITINSEPTDTVTVLSSVKLWATNVWEGITNVIWSFGDGLADASSSVVNGISEVVNAIFTTTGEKTVTATFKDSANATIAQRTTSITVVAASSSALSSSISLSSASSSLSSSSSSRSSTSSSFSTSSSTSNSSVAPSTLVPEFVPIPGKSFSMSKYETTFAEYDAYAEETGAAKPFDMGWGRGNRPVILVSWNDAVAYAAWLSQKTGKSYRLPTEEEWEFAARAGSTTNYSWGDEIGINNANCNGCGSQWDNKQTAPVGSFKANNFGLFDMHGNAIEFTQTCFVAGCTSVVLRSGSSFTTPDYLRSSSGFGFPNSERNADNGFRLVQDTDINPPQTETTLVGSWYFSDTTKAYPQQNHMLITFIDATHYTAVMDVEEGSFNCKDGAEYGTYTWNSATGELKASSIIDNNGECGVDAPVPGTWTLANANTELVTQETGGNKTTLKKVANDAGIKGSWAMQRESDIYVLTILDDTHYIGSWPTDTEHDFEYGTYTYNATTGELVAKPLNFSAEFSSTMMVKNNQLERTQGTEKDIWQRLPMVITNQTPSEYIGTLSVTGGETYPLRVILRQKNGLWALGEYDFHKLDGTMTPCEHDKANDATCHGAHSTFIKTADNSVISSNNGVIVSSFSTEIDQYGYTFTGTLSTPSLVWSGTWTKAATANSSYTASGTFSVKVVQIPFHPVAPIYGRDFSMGVIETTFDQYDAYANATGAAKPDDAGWGRGKRPVINVSFNDAVAYAAWLSEKTGNKYRLPTEEEWELAARAGTTTKYSWGDAMGTNRCNGCAGNEWKGQKTAPIASYNPNGFGLLDMEGNVMEWTQSCFNQTDCNARSVRGGSFDMWPPAEGLIAVRLPAATTFRANSLGFRLIQENDSIFEPLPAVTPEFVPISGRTFSISKYKTSHAEYFAYSTETGVKSRFGAGLGGGISSVVVSWNDAVAYAAWLSQKTGKTYRLPTGEELEFLAANNFGLNDLRAPTWEWTSSCPNDYCTGSGLNKNDPDDITGFHLVQDKATININLEPATTISVFSSLKVWATNVWEGITSVIWSFGDGLADASSTVVNGISDFVNAIFTTTGEKTITVTFKDSANATVAQRTTSITVVAASSSSASSSAAEAISRLELKADTYLTIATDNSLANLSCTAYNKDNSLINNPQCIFYVDETPINSSQFSSSIHGKFKIYAKMGNIISNQIEIEARENINYDEISIPIIFHLVHFGEPVGTGNNLSQADINEILSSLNEAFSAPQGSKNPNAVDMKIRFRLAKYNKDNQLMEEAGIERIDGTSYDNHIGLNANNQIIAGGFSFSFNDSIDIVGDKLIGPNESDWLTHQTFWNQNEYKNIWIMPTLYHESYTSSPIIKKEGTIPGLNYFSLEDFDLYGFRWAKTITLDTSSAKYIIAHEVGHSLGLSHTFANDNCKTTDYAPDTYSYNKFGTAFDCDGNLGLKTLDNIMGYDFDGTLTRIFTYDQRERVRQVFQHAYWHDNLKNSNK